MDKKGQIPVGAIAAINSRRIARENKNRRERNGRSDQIFVKYNNKNVAGQKLVKAGLYDYYNKEYEQLYDKGEGWSSTTLVVWVIIYALISWAIYGLFYDTFIEMTKNNKFITFSIVYLVIAMLLTFVNGQDESEDNLIFKDKGLLIQIFDGDGYRNIDEDIIEEIINALR